MVETAARRSPTPFDVVRQSCGKVIEQQAHPARRLQVLMHDEPYLQRVMEGIRQHGDKLRHATRNILLAAADAEAGAQRRKLREIVVAAEAESLARQSARK